ncbi:deleted in malignant brain tumors 1 protein-like [Branchiostoma floridae]|uniref:Deleted in malignant brain tumors 1 protein-like n=2 Tax=Branchiostoma floridae TaxID=7739 RepID=A0A9J7KHQ9_BRAFL|nr:deleted in malignant brain tumors 1 protein-like [Branchiostoma floridae]
MASAVLLGVLALCVSFPARAQDVRRQYVAGCGSFSPPGFEKQLADMKEETDRMKNQVDLLSLVQTLMIQQSDLTSRVNSLEQQKTSQQGLMDSLTNQLSEERVRSAKLESRVQNLTTTLYEHDINIKQRLQCSCERLVPDDVISTITATLPSEPVFTTVAPVTKVTSPTEPKTDTPTESPAAKMTTTTQPGISPPAAELTGPVTGIQIRLAAGSTQLEGRVEVRNGTGQWGSVCDDNFDLQDAHVVCRQLDFGAALEVKLAGHFGEGSGNVWLDEVACRGIETDLGDCPADSWGRSDCSHKEDVGVICAGDAALRLVGGRAPWKGRLQIRPWGALEWGAVCNTSWTEAEAGFVCRQMGYTGGVTSSGQADIGEGPENIWLGDVTCSGDETNILSCGFSWEPSDCDHRQDVHVICTGRVSVRLAGSQNPSEGRVEIHPGNGDWGTVCDDGFDDRDAQVVCRQLGYYTGSARVGGLFPEGTGNIWLDNLNCAGNESSVAGCEINRWGDHDCTHKEDAGVVCEAEEEDCAEYHSSGVTTSGVYPIGLLPDDVEAYCDMDTAGESRYAEYSTFRVSGESDGYRLRISGYSGTAGNSMALNGYRFSTVDRDNDGSSSRHCSQGYGQGGWWFGACGSSALNGRYLGNCGSSCPAWQGVVWHNWRGGSYSLKSVSMKIRP